MGLWECSICTYSNDDSLSYCDTCGVFRDSSTVVENNDEDDDKVYSKGKDNEASLMAKSLFARKPCSTPKTSFFANGFIIDEANGSYGKGSSTRASFKAFHNTFMALNHNKSVKIVRFRFDSLSPDDVVSSAKNLTRSFSIGESAVSRVSSNITGGKGILKFSPKIERPNNSSASLSTEQKTNGHEKRSNAGDGDDTTGMLSSSLHHLKLDKKPTSSRKATPVTQYKPEKWVLSIQEDMPAQLNLAIVGHVDSGKSTLSGRLLHLLGRISKKIMHKYEKEAKEKGKGSFAYAWAMDESSEERERGITMTVAVAYFESKRYRVVLLDSPGHKDLVPNMISGVTQADAAILVVDASVGSFEAGMDGNGIGQTKEHAQLIRSLGVEQIIVSINKMDMVEYSKERFSFIKSQLGSFLRCCGFKESHVTWLPLSAMENQNLVTATSDARLSSWYKGPCLLDAIDSLQTPLRDILKPLLLPVCDVVSSHSLGQVAACGKLERGAVRNGSKVVVMPSGDLAAVRAVERDSVPCTTATAGDNVAVSLQGIDGAHLLPGSVLCHPDFPVSISSRLELKLLVLEIRTPILIGSLVEFHIHHAKTVASVVKIVSVIDQKSGKASKKAPRCLTAKQSALIEVSLDEAVCVEEFSSCRALGRVFLRSAGNTIAVGIVTRVIMDPES